MHFDLAHVDGKLIFKTTADGREVYRKRTAEDLGPRVTHA